MDEKNMAARFDHAAESLGQIGTVVKKLPDSIKSKAQEIRLRSGRQVVISLPGESIFVSETGSPAFNVRSGLLTADKPRMEEAFRLICESSVHSHQQEIRNGFVTLKGGHRAGICGTAVLQDTQLSNIRDISSINLRVAREIKGAADETAASLFSDGLCGALIIGPPGCGKTTVLRDLARQLSSGIRGNYRVAVVDERGEIAATYRGMPQNDLGFCDVLDGYPKGEGMIQAVRSLSPDVIICDEIGGQEDAFAVEFSLNAGVAVIASAHAGSLEELCRRPQFESLLQSGAFRKAVILKGRKEPGRIASVYGRDNFYASESRRHDRGVFGLQRGGAYAVGQTVQAGTTA